jgi:prepilin-type N-terminal cleavage/methylation domain-containing protein
MPFPYAKIYISGIKGKEGAEALVNHYKKLGFTIVELLIVIVVIGILATIVIVGYSGIQNRAKDAAAQSAASQAYKKINTFAVQNADAYPADLDEAGLLNAEGYEYSVDNASDPKTFCLTATTDGVSYYVSDTSPIPTSGLCPGHTGSEEVALTCPDGFIVVPGSVTYGTSDFCVMQYEARNSGGTAISTATGLPWVSINRPSAITTASAACSGCHLIDEDEWLTIAQNVLSVDANWSGGSVGSGCIFRGNNGVADACGYNGSNPEGGTGRNSKASLTLTNGEVIWDFASNVWEWTTGSTTGGQPGAPGTAWRDWNALSVAGTVSPNPHPSYANPSASAWNSDQGIGKINSDSSQVAFYVFQRGGGWNDNINAGVFGLNTSLWPNNTSVNVGFRVAQ